MRIARAKRDTRARNAAWRQALAEGRVLRHGATLTSYPTIEARDAALAKADGCAHIVVAP